MKIIIEYDFTNKIKDVNESYGIVKMLRNNGKDIIRLYLPICIIFDLIFALNSKITAKVFLLYEILSYLEIEYFAYKEYGDHYKELAIKDLKRLVSLLKDNDIIADYDLLLKSEVYEKKYKLRLNEDKIIEVLESKYILVPTYDFNGHIKDTSILQEHVIGSDDYVLSFGSPAKKLKLVYANSYH